MHMLYKLIAAFFLALSLISCEEGLTSDLMVSNESSANLVSITVGDTDFGQLDAGSSSDYKSVSQSGSFSLKTDTDYSRSEDFDGLSLGSQYTLHIYDTTWEITAD
jgi:hypothetical protein